MATTKPERFKQGQQYSFKRGNIVVTGTIIGAWQDAVSEGLVIRYGGELHMLQTRLSEFEPKSTGVPNGPPKE